MPKRQPYHGVAFPGGTSTRVGSGIPLGIPARREPSTTGTAGLWGLPESPSLGCAPCLGTPLPLHTSPGVGDHLPVPCPPQPMHAVPSLEPGRCLGQGWQLLVRVTYGTASQPGLLHGDIVTRSVPECQQVPAWWWPSQRRRCPGLSQAVVPAAAPGSVAGTSTRPGTSDSQGAHDQVLGFLTQQGRWQWVAWPLHWPWAGGRGMACWLGCAMADGMLAAVLSSFHTGQCHSTVWWCATPWHRPGCAGLCHGMSHLAMAHAMCHTTPWHVPF